MQAEQWLLTPAERGNEDTDLDARHPGRAWSEGNQVRPLVHGAAYFGQLLRDVRELRAGDVLMFTDWRGDPDERLGDTGDTAVGQVFAAAAERGVVVKGLLWRSHWDRLQFSERENRHLGEVINRAGGECVRDMRVRPGGCHHQKIVVLRHPGRPDLDVAYVGGIDLCHSRHDDAKHAGDPQPQPMAAVYGPTPPWHDVQLEIRGPAVGDVEAAFRERWNDPTPVTRNPLYRISDALHHDDDKPGPLPDPLPDPAPVGSHAVQVLRTYPPRRPAFPFARAGERSVARAYQKVMRRAQHLIYLEDQYLWARPIVECMVDALAAHPQLRLIAVVPHFPDQDGLAVPPNLVGRSEAMAELHAAGGDRVAVYGVENPKSVPVYVHAKVCVVDDVWASVGSDNVNRRSWTHDSELSCAVLDETPAQRGSGHRFAQDLRLELAREHLDRDAGDDADLVDPVSAFEAFHASAAELQAWHDSNRRGVRPPGRLRPYRPAPLTRWTRTWATPMYRLTYDPDGRSRRMRRRNDF